jgi:hypothetical protein
MIGGLCMIVAAICVRFVDDVGGQESAVAAPPRTGQGSLAVAGD